MEAAEGMEAMMKKINKFTRSAMVLDKYGIAVSGVVYAVELECGHIVRRGPYSNMKKHKPPKVGGRMRCPQCEGGDKEKNGAQKHEPLKELFVLYTNNGEMFSVWETLREAIDDAMGPAFRPYAKIVRFVPDGNWPKRVKGG